LLSFAFGEVMMIAHRSEVMRLHTYFDRTFNVLSLFSQSGCPFRFQREPLGSQSEQPFVSRVKNTPLTANHRIWMESSKGATRTTVRPGGCFISPQCSLPLLLPEGQVGVEGAAASTSSDVDLSVNVFSADSEKKSGLCFRDLSLLFLREFGKAYGAS
jgi:hypothetical protein